MQKLVPIILRQHFNSNEIVLSDPFSAQISLGSFWPNFDLSFESHIVKTFKKCNPVSNYQPYILNLCMFYSNLIANACRDYNINYVCRVLSSSETKIDCNRPQSLLVNTVCDKLEAKNISECFYKSSSRPPLRSIKRLSGANAIKSRVQYIIQDLFFVLENISGNVLIIDDIGNTGASLLVYANAIRKYTVAEEIYGINLAATRFNRGKDGLGFLKLDTSYLNEYPGLDKVYLDSSGIYHRDGCKYASGKLYPRLDFFCKQNASPCKECFKEKTRKHTWWMFWQK